jgi:hypothetical protein
VHAHVHTQDGSSINDYLYVAWWVCNAAANIHEQGSARSSHPSWALNIPLPPAAQDSSLEVTDQSWFLSIGLSFEGPNILVLLLESNSAIQGSGPQGTQ